MNEGLASKNVQLGKNYVVNSKLNVLKAEGIQCFEGSGMNEHKLIVVESKLKHSNEASGIDSQFKEDQKSPSFIF